MEPEKEVSAGSTPAVCIDEGAVDVLMQVGEDDKKAPQEVSRNFISHTKLPIDNVPDVEHKDMDRVLIGFNGRIEKMQLDVATAEKKLADSQNEHMEEVSLLRHQLQSSVSIGDDKIKALETEGARLVQELNASKEEVSDLKKQLGTVKQDHGEIVSQVDGLKETIHMLKRQLEASNEQAEKTKEKFSEQVDAYQTDVASKMEALESLGKVHSDLLLELQEVKRESQKSLSMSNEQVITLEGMLKNSQEEMEASLLLQAENASLKSMLSELSTGSKERLEQAEEEHQEQLKAQETRCEALQKSLSKLEERVLQLQDSLSAPVSDGEVARGEVANLEAELGSLLKTKNELEQGASELQSQLKSMEEMASKQVDSLKVAEENADTAKQQALHLQSVLNTTEVNLRVSEEAGLRLQQQMNDLIIKEARSAEYLKEAEDSSQKMQLELQSKLDTLVAAVVPQLEEKVALLEDLLSTAKSDGDGARKKVRELEVELASLHDNQAVLVERVKLFEEKGSEYESAAHISSMRVLELEGLITEYESKAVVMSDKVATLEAALVESQNHATYMEMQLRLAKDSSLLQEKGSEEQVSKIEELQKLLAERKEEVNGAVIKMEELKLSIEALESKLKSASEKEMFVNNEKLSVEEKLAKLEAARNELESSMHQHKSLVEKGEIDLQAAICLEKELRGTITTLEAAMSELQGVLIQTEEEKQATITSLESAMKDFAELNNQLVEERRQLQQQIAMIVQEIEDLRQQNASAQEKLHVALAAAELSAKQVQDGSLKESILRDQVEDLKLRLEKAHDACVKVEALAKEKEDLAHEFSSAQEKLHAFTEAAELSAGELRAASLKESTLSAEIEDLKTRLGQAMDAYSHVERLLENSISREEHQAQIDQILAASMLAQSKLADVEEQLLKSKMEMKDAQNCVSNQETHVRELDLNTVKAMELFEKQPSDFNTVRESDLDVQSPLKVRNRKKKGVTWETDSVLKPNAAVHKSPQRYPVQSLHHYVAHLLIALISLTIGFWLARKVHS